MRPFFVLSLVASLVVPAGAHAQTVEETVAFIVLGLEDNSNKMTKHGTAKIIQRSSSPAIYDFVGAPLKGGIERVTVRSIKKCTIGVTIVGDPEEPVEIVYDFDKFIDLDLSLGLPILTFTPSCGVSRDNLCSAKAPLEVTMPVDRLLRALSYLRSNFCAGNAF